MRRKADPKSDFRDPSAREKGSVVDEDGANVTLRGPRRADFEALKRAACIWAPMGAQNHRHVIATSEEDVGKGDVPGISVTRSVLGDGSAALS